MKRSPLFAALWNQFQGVIGNNASKTRALSSCLPQPGRILEIGCATGNLAQAFDGFTYVGVDTDADSIRYAQSRFAEPGCRFFCVDLTREPAPFDGEFDYVVISHTAHHLPDAALRRLLAKSHEFLRAGGRLVLLDMIRPEPHEPFRRQFYYRLDRGEHFRDRAEFEAIFEGEGSFSDPTIRIVETHKWGIEVIDQILIEATKAGS